MTWTTVKLTDLATVSSGGGAPQDADAFSSEGIPFVRAGSLVKLLGGQPEESLELLQPDVAAAHKLKLFPAGTVLFAKSGMSATKGHVYQLKNPAFVVNHLAALTPRSKSAGDYLRHVLRFKSPTCLIMDEAYPSIRLGDIENMEVPAPGADLERQRIAAILDQADELRRKRQRAIDRLNQLGQAIFHEMFGETEEEVSIFEYLDDIQSGKSVVGVDDNNGSGYRVLKISAVSRNGFRAGESKPLPYDYVPPSTHLVHNGDLIFSRANTTELVGIPCIVDGVQEKVALPDKLWRLVPSPKKSVSAFLCHALLSHSTRRQIEKMCSGTSGSMQNISMQKFKNIRVPRASIGEQLKFRDAIEIASSGKAALVASQSKIDDLFRGLQHRAFQGEL